jgi:hypothetical protein
MSKVVRVQTGNYKIITAPGGTITLDTGGETGTVVITGDLIVNGNTTTIESETLTVKDNIIYINEGETGSGVVSLGPTSGLQIDRGQETDVSFLWDERIGSFVLVDASYVNPQDSLHSYALSLGVRSIVTGGSNLTLIGANLGSADAEEGVVDVVGTIDYERKVLNYDLLNSYFEIINVGRVGNLVTIEVNQPHGLLSGSYVYVNCYPLPQINTGTDSVEITRISDTVFTYILVGSNINPSRSFFPGFAGTVRPVNFRNDDYIPNMKAVADYTASALTSFATNKIQQGDSRIIVTDNDIPDENGNFSQVSEIRFDINSANQVIINNLGLSVDNIQIDNNTIKNKNLSLDKILFDSVLELKVKPGDPGVEPGYVSLYSKPIPGTGGTGLFFVNTEGTRDELISKTKALLYSLIL